MDLGMYIPARYGKGYPPNIFTNLNYLQNSINNDTSDSKAELLATNSKPASDWDEDLIDLTQVDDACKQDKNPQPYDQSDEKNTASIAKAQWQATPNIHLQVGQAGDRRKAFW